MNARIVLFYGAGGSAIEWWANGERLLQQRFKTAGAECILLNWDQRQEAYNFMFGFYGKKAYLGDSLGAGSAGQYPGDLKVPVDFAGGFQPSDDDARTTHVNGELVQIVAPNIIHAHALYDPVWLDTMGLGQTEYAKAEGAKTIVMNTAQRGAHPNDWGSAQDLLFNQAIGLLAAS